MNEPKVQTGKESERPEEPPNLFECTVCLDILHPECAEKTMGRGQVNSELSNSWECSKCINSGYSSAPSRAGPANKRPAPVTPPGTGQTGSLGHNVPLTAGHQPMQAEPQEAKRPNLMTPPPHQMSF